MIVIAIRLAVGITLFFGGVVLIDWVFDTDVLGAVGRAVLWFWRGTVEFFARLAGDKESESGLRQYLRGRGTNAAPPFTSQGRVHGL